MGLRAKEDGASESRSVMERIGIEPIIGKIIPAKASRLPSGLSSQENLTNRRRRRSG